MNELTTLDLIEVLCEVYFLSPPEEDEEGFTGCWLTTEAVQAGSGQSEVSDQPNSNVTRYEEKEMDIHSQANDITGRINRREAIVRGIMEKILRGAGQSLDSELLNRWPELEILKSKKSDLCDQIDQLNGPTFDRLVDGLDCILESVEIELFFYVFRVPHN